MKLLRKAIDWLTARIDLALAPRPVVIKIDQSSIAVARPGDLVVFSVAQSLRGEERKSLSEWLARAAEGSPGVTFYVAEAGVTRATLISGESEK